MSIGAVGAVGGNALGREPKALFGAFRSMRY
jgi:hypothetical protein